MELKPKLGTESKARLRDGRLVLITNALSDTIQCIQKFSPEVGEFTIQVHQDERFFEIDAKEIEEILTES